MAGETVLSRRDASRVEQMLRWFESTGKKLGPNMFRRRNISGGANIKIFEVQSAATGDGVYNCHEQKLLSAEWEGTSGNSKVSDVDEPEEIEVLNLEEFDPIADYERALAIGDLIKAWRWKDDEGTMRWVGLPCGPVVRGAITTQAAPADTKITANLYKHDGTEITGGLGSGIDVYCDIAGGGNLNTAIPRLEGNQPMSVYNEGGKWWCTTIFQASEVCDCYTAP